ncbi:MAG: VCBS repeat-containing protein [Planctomycetota bacterium]|nr:VCBS repeat-containing protein [Planctomycetota bacterium]
MYESLYAAAFGSPDNEDVIVKLKEAIPALAFAAAILWVASPAGALIKLEQTVSKIYEQSKTVLVGKVAGVNPDTRVVDVTIVEALKGKSPGEKMRVQIASPAEVLKEVAPGQPLVFLLGEGEGAIHLADTWLLATGIPNSNMQAWRVVQLYDAGRQGFPGRTAALVRLVTDLKAGKSTILNKWERKPFAGGVHKRGKLNIQKPSWVMACDVNGDKKPDLLVGSAAGTRLLLATAGGAESSASQYQDVTEQWGLSGGAGGYHAFGDVDGDGKTDLLLDDTLWLNRGGKFVAAKARLELPGGGARPLAAALADVTGDQKPDALLLAANGELRIF